MGTSLTDATLAKVVSNQLKKNTFPVDNNGIYLVLTSSDMNNVTLQGANLTVFCGIHGDFKYTAPNGAHYDLVYAFAAYPKTQDACGCLPIAGDTSPNGPSLDAIVSTISHELAEVQTDPFGYGWGVYDSDYPKYMYEVRL
jgi:hypothetical protein